MINKPETLYTNLIEFLKNHSLNKSDIKGLRVYQGAVPTEEPIKDLDQLKEVYMGGCTGFVLFKDNTWLEISESWCGSSLEYFSPPVLD